ncbi:hypothetical protein [Bacillus cereus]|nr:hypothetical protein [Bacillus cereus]EJS76902.1 hypothetical protein ICY_01913 [Bacillus cereus BAG2X1-3]
MQLSKHLFSLLLIAILFLNSLCLTETLASESEIVTIDKIRYLFLKQMEL